jgi:hypothetical protein
MTFLRNLFLSWILKLGAAVFVGVLFVLIVVVDISAYFHLIQGAVGMYLWLLVLLYLICLGLLAFFSLVKRSIKSKTFFSLLALLVLLIFLIVNVDNPANISGETTQQTACALDYWQNSPDKGFQQTCFLGYPARQYLPLAIPTWLAGRSIASLNLGGSLYFLVGILLWLNGLFNFLEGKPKYKDLLAGLSVLFLLHFHFVNHFLFHCYEQSQFPLSLSLAFWGIFLWQLKKSAVWKVFTLGLLLLLLASAYTPALAFFALGLLLIIYLGVARKSSWKLILLILVGGLISFLIAWSFRNDVKLLGENNSSISAILNDASSLFTHLWLRTQDSIVYSTFWGKLFLLLALITPLVLRDKRLIFLSIWLVITMVMATTAQGYSFYHLNFRIHRSIVVLPTAMLLVTLFLQKIKLPRWLLVVLFGVTAVWGLSFADQYLQTKEVSGHYQLINFLQNNLHNFDQKDQLVMFDEAGKYFISVNDFAGYFLPQFEITKMVYSSELCRQLVLDPTVIVMIDANSATQYCQRYAVPEQIHLFNIFDQKLLIIE